MSRFNNPTDAVKVFGMTNQLAETELSAVEAELGLDLGRGLQRGNDRDDTYYPQFEQQVRREAAEMARHYEIFYCLEKSIRKLVSETIESSPPGPNWWSRGCVPEPIAKGVADRMQREKDTGVTGYTIVHAVSTPPPACDRLGARHATGLNRRYSCDRSLFQSPTWEVTLEETRVRG